MSTISVNAVSLFFLWTRMDEGEMNKIWPRKVSVSLPVLLIRVRIRWCCGQGRDARTGWSNCCQEVVINRLIGDLSHIFRPAYSLPSLLLIDSDYEQPEEGVALNWLDDWPWGLPRGSCPDYIYLIEKSPFRNWPKILLSPLLLITAKCWSTSKSLQCGIERIPCPCAHPSPVPHRSAAALNPCQTCTLYGLHPGPAVTPVSMKWHHK